MTRTIVFHHPVPGTGFAPRPTNGDDVVVCPNRPGYGPRPFSTKDATPTIAGTAEQLLDRLERDGIDHIDLAVGWSGGGHFALAMAALAPDVVDAVALIATPAHDDDVAWIPDHLLSDLEAWRRSPERAVDLVMEQLDGIAAHRSMVCAGRDDQLLLAADPQLRTTVDRMLAAAFRNGPTGMALDIVAQHVNGWGFDPTDVRQPVHLFYAADDPIVPAEHGNHWAATLPHSTITITPSSGHLVPLQRAWHDLGLDADPRRRRRATRRSSQRTTLDPLGAFSIRHRPSGTDTF